MNSRIKQYYIGVIVFIFYSILILHTAYATKLGEGYDQIAIPNTDLTINDVGIQGSLFSIIDKVISFGYQIVGVVTVAIGLWAAYLMLTAQDDKAKFAKGSKMLTYMAYGLIVFFLASSAHVLLTSFLPDLFS